jgi:predicted transposase YbfD/YdcC
MKCRRIPKRLRRFLSNIGLLGAVTKALKDPRHRKGRQWAFDYLVELLLTGALVQARSLAEVERCSEQVGLRVPDSTLSYLLARIDPTPLREVLRDNVRTMIRSKTLRPEGLPFGVLAIDGKTSWTGGHAADVEAQQQGHDFTLRWMRAVLTSARSRPCIDQDVIPAKTNEMGHFPTFWKALRRAYSRADLFALVTLDAGYSSKQNAKIIDDDGCGYLLRIKGEQPTLLAEMKRLLLPRAGQPEAVSPWESVKGRQVQHRLVRRREIAGFDDWAHSRQAWLVQTVVRHKDGHEEVVMERYYLTNLLWNALSANQILHVVRGHWSIENDCNWVLDVAWEEDTTAWATNAGQVATHHPLRTLSWLRMLAYNVLGWLLRVRLRSRPTWSALRDALRRVLLPIPSATEMELELLPLG